MLRTIIAVNYCIESIMEGLQKMTMDQLVDILAQKTGKFTQLLVYKNFGKEYKECKEAIQQILAEIELRKGNNLQNIDPFLNQSNSGVQ